MEKLLVKGRKRLVGEVMISGAKNAAVAVLPAAIMAGGKSVLENLPNIEDVSCICNTIEKLGGKCIHKDKHTIEIDCSGGIDYCATFEEVQRIRASYYFLGALLARYKKAEVAMPGGCNFGKRPIDLHLKGFRALGATVEEECGFVRAYADKLVGAPIYMDQVSVGATINIMLAATMAEGVTTIENAAKEPHVVDTANYLNMMGANIKGAGTDVIRIIGVEKLNGAQYAIIPDQIEAGTYMIAAAITGGDVLVKNIIPKHMDSLTAKLVEMNVKMEEGDDSIRVMANKPLRGVNVKTMSYPGFPTDLQPQMAALLSICNGTSVITENVWENRYQYIEELCKLGAKVDINGRIATIEGIPHYQGAKVEATDLRAGAAMILAALAAEGTTQIDGVRYIDRGYEDVEMKLSALGADIQRVLDKE
ncbi:UDP-N-acetylglucosamine 1-carboxyvinyltransferase [Anaerotignum propionicum]|jgi:UDP-N-acetylglucosamine 1-carboxyvinyltransferase|uniref:UDP-N-acetylglucosamine 1-carboxyvinyltransferase n=2 Tax=Anaerotignum propionicum TaxID=28446 RepID=A0A0X8VEK2_ANAPI|nr:UDP-N-acetylglucosamine 1-carboxyvinyltransferase [Anaerotignum propionicum]AMJ42237.1 UDP-N-acetylglucosamine 1-carboxyvinyltransferase 2 [Anaerotignum propionicum DSM 1682]SHE54508.1 UDP-N-acetylglucosamine 1-carboxyvinyltransferase [[Clostridium] propionicum DSM 1682] [Anaerotignum propionicum DSM 1682]